MESVLTAVFSQDRSTVAGLSPLHALIMSSEQIATTTQRRLCRDSSLSPATALPPGLPRHGEC
jgi:hypothetical protein